MSKNIQCNRTRITNLENKANNKLSKARYAVNNAEKGSTSNMTCSIMIAIHYYHIIISSFEPGPDVY